MCECNYYPSNKVANILGGSERLLGANHGITLTWICCGLGGKGYLERFLGKPLRLVGLEHNLPFGWCNLESLCGAQRLGYSRNFKFPQKTRGDFLGALFGGNMGAH